MFTTITRLETRLPANIYQQLLAVPEIDGPKRCSHFLGQIKTESNFTNFTENLNYSAERLLAVFPKYFKDQATANLYARQPEKIANRVYANRMGNGNEQSGDGWKHRGFGPLQVTGKINQQAFFKSIGLPENSDPQLIATTYAMSSAAWFFTTRNLWIICDRGVDDTTITTVSEKVNGGHIHLETRIAATKYFYQMLTS